MKFKYVSIMGDVFRLSNSGYKKYLQRVIAEEDVNVTECGGRYVGTPVHVTDLTPQDAQDLLNECN